MGWGDCGNDSEGRPIGYGFEAVCDHPGCNKSIDRGLDFSCGGMHGDDEISCEKYFCYDHLTNCVDYQDHLHAVCNGCAKILLESEDFEEDEEEGIIKEKEKK